MRITKFTSQYQHLVSDFTCGNIVIDNFLKSSLALDSNQGVTYILLSDQDDFIIGFYNIEVGRVDQIENIGGNISVSPMGGSFHINYLAIHTRYQHFLLTETDGRKGYWGDFLLKDCEQRIAELRQYVGATFVTLYSTAEGYHLYHDRNDYEAFEDDMSTFVKDSDISAHKLYKCIDDLE